MPYSSSDMERLLQREGAEPGIWLLTLKGDMLVSAETPAGIVRLTNNEEAITSRGNVFSVGGFSFVPPEEGAEQPVVRLSVPNVDRRIGLDLLDASDQVLPVVVGEGLEAKFELVWASARDVVVTSIDMLKLRQVSFDPLVVEGVLSVAQLDNEPYGSIRVVPANFPWLSYA